MTPEVQLKKLKELKSSKGWQMLKEQLERKRANSALCVLNRNWQSTPEFTMDDLHKREINTINWVFAKLEAMISTLETQTAVETKEDDMDIWDVDDLYKEIAS